MNYTTYGPGDEITWPPYSGHPNDPRGYDEVEPSTDELVAHLATHIHDDGLMNEVTDLVLAGLDDDDWHELMAAIARTKDPAFRNLQQLVAEHLRDHIERHMAATEHDYA